MGILSWIDDYIYERRARRKQAFILRMETLAENHRICQETKSAGMRMWERKHREQVEREAQNKAQTPR
jgi:hypothetical protein